MEHTRSSQKKISQNCLPRLKTSPSRATTDRLWWYERRRRVVSSKKKEEGRRGGQRQHTKTLRKQKRKKSSAFRLAQNEEDDANWSRREQRTLQRSTKRSLWMPLGTQHLFPTIVHNYTFWADIIFEQKSNRTREWHCMRRKQTSSSGLSFKSADHIASVVMEKFVEHLIRGSHASQQMRAMNGKAFHHSQRSVNLCGRGRM